MLDWLRGGSRSDNLLSGPLGDMMDQMAMATAIAEVMGSYHRAAKILPIVNDRDAGAVDVWNGTRLEAISKLWNFGSARLDLMIDPTKHPVLIDAIIEKSSSRLCFRDATGDEITDSISAILRVYDYLEILDHDVGVPFYQSSEKGPAFVSQYGPFISEMRKLKIRWQGFKFSLQARGKLPKQPETIFLTIWKDVTWRSKIIALCSRFGPSYMPNIQALRDQVVTSGQSPAKFDDVLIKMLTGDDPDLIYSEYSK